MEEVHGIKLQLLEVNFGGVKQNFELKILLTLILSGYLATITSAAENDYVLDKIRDDFGNPVAAWFGGN